MRRDGVGASPWPGLGEKAGWVVDMLSAVDPRTWLEHFERAPHAILALAENSEFAVLIRLSPGDRPPCRHDPRHGCWTSRAGGSAPSLGSVNRAARNRRPRHQDIDGLRTIRANLKHYQPDYQTLILETRSGFAGRGRSLRDIVPCVDQSGSMASSVAHASVFAVVLASIRAVTTSVVVFDTAVADLTPLLSEPVEVLFGTQLGGCTDINPALTYCQQLVTRARGSILVLISDLDQGGNRAEMLARATSLVGSGVQVWPPLLALDDSGAPPHDHANAAAFTAMGIPCFACTPDLFPDLMMAAIQKQSLAQWALQAGIVHA